MCEEGCEGIRDWGLGIGEWGLGIGKKYGLGSGNMDSRLITLGKAADAVRRFNVRLLNFLPPKPLTNKREIERLKDRLLQFFKKYGEAAAKAINTFFDAVELFKREDYAPQCKEVYYLSYSTRKVMKRLKAQFTDTDLFTTYEDNEVTFFKALLPPANKVVAQREWKTQLRLLPNKRKSVEVLARNVIDYLQGGTADYEVALERFFSTHTVKAVVADADKSEELVKYGGMKVVNGRVLDAEPVKPPPPEDPYALQRALQKSNSDIRGAKYYLAQIEMDLLFSLPERSPWQFFRVAQLMEKTVVNAIDEFDKNLMERKWFRQGLAIFSETPYANRPRREQDVSQLMNDIGDALADFIITLSKWCARRVATDFFNPKPGDALTRAFCIAFADLPKDLERTEAVKECLFQSLFFADDEIFRYRGLPFAVLLEACMGKVRPDPNDIPEDVKHEVQSASYGFYECNYGGWTDSRCDEWIEKTVVAIDLARQRIEREKATSEEEKKLNERVEGIVIDQIGNYLLNAANFLKDCGPNFEDEPDEDYEPLSAMLRDYIKRAPGKLRDRVYSVCDKLEREVSENGEIDFPDMPFLKIVVAPFTDMYFS